MIIIKNTFESQYNKLVPIVLIFLTFIPTSSLTDIVQFIVVLILWIFNGDRHIDYSFLIWVLSFTLGISSVVLLENTIYTSFVLHELARLIYFALLVSVCRTVTMELKYLFQLCLIVILLHFSIQLGELLRIPQILSLIENIYLNGDITNAHYLLSQGSLGGGFRSGSIFINPNVYACYTYLSIGVFIQYTHTYKKKTLQYILMALCFFSVFLTGSRMGLASFFIIIFYYTIRYRSNSVRIVDWFFSSILLFTLIILFISNYHSVLKFFLGARAFDFSSSYALSLGTKIDNFFYYIKNSNMVYLLFGCLGSYLSQIPVDMEYGYIIEWYGLLGLFWYFPLVFRPLRLNNITKIIGNTCVLAILLTAIAATSLLNIKVFPYICIIGFTKKVI